jgi:energy-coupling factor transport system permease protein
LYRDIRLHPGVLLCYFLLVGSCSMVLLHPVCLLLSFVCSLLFYLLLKGRRALPLILKGLLPLMVLTALLNPLFNHQGMTILAYFPSGNPLTLESIYYGLANGLLFGSVLCWYACFSTLITSDQIVCLLGRAAPSLGLLLSMALGFVPRFRRQLKQVRRARQGVGMADQAPSLRRRVREAASAVSILITWALEHGMTLADGMKSRGYGLRGRSHFSLYPIIPRDICLLICLGLAAGGMIWGGFSGAFSVHYFPRTGWEISGWNILFFGLYGLICAAPILAHLWEVRQWKHIPSIS